MKKCHGKLLTPNMMLYLEKLNQYKQLNAFFFVEMLPISQM